MSEQSVSKAEVDAGELMRSRGWKQGTMVKFQGPVQCAVALNDGELNYRGDFAIPEKADGTYLVVTQTCDLVAPDNVEPFVELVLCTIDEDGGLKSKSRNSTRWFNVGEQDLVAHAPFRMTVVKRDLARLEPMDWPGTLDRLNLFRAWLEKRQGRIALPDLLVEAIINPLREVIDGNRKRAYINVFNNAVREIRMTLPIETESPFTFSLLLILDGEISLEDAGHFEKAVKKIQSKFDEHSSSHLEGIIRVTPEGILLSDYNRTTTGLYLLTLTW